MVARAHHWTGPSTKLMSNALFREYAPIGSAIALALALSGCGGGVTVPATPEGQACSSACTQLDDRCLGFGRSETRCAQEQRSCLLSCPGAHQD